MTTDPLLNAALDRFDVPPPSANLAARIMAAAETREAVTEAPALPAAAPRRDRRGAWVRARNLVLGTAALGLMSATAAASGLFGGQRIHIPVISTIVAAAIPEQKKPAPPKVAPKEAPKLAKRDIPKVEPVPEVIVPAPPPPEAIPGTPEARRAERADRIAERMEARLARIEAERAAAGKPAPTGRRRALLDQLKAAKTDEERRAALAAIEADNTRLRERRAAQLGVDPATLKQKRSPVVQLTPEQRRAMLERRAARLGLDPAELEARRANQPQLSLDERKARFEKRRAERRARMEVLRKAQGDAPAETPAADNVPPAASEIIQ